VQTIVYEEFCRWFDAEAAGRREKYREVSVKIGEGVPSGGSGFCYLGTAR
jgi:hypothetical protein